jgi:hypothetical protein
MATPIIQTTPPALTDFQQSQLWDLWIGAATRTLYFSTLANRFSRWQNVIQGATLFMSGSAVTAILLDPHTGQALPSIVPYLPFAKLSLPVATGVANTVGLFKQYTKRSFECSELYQKWGRLEQDCQRLWGAMYDEDAPDKLTKLQERALEISVPATRSMPNKHRLMARCQDEATGKIEELLGVKYAT